ncbi:hypothetical protein KUTeg_012899 [Tegillarca granosa]|uniref:Uncharacterized protein n=1 Tax=Tegillarca granosa TaxID=220873 RepID=A0ABQ9EXB6_TEGGR|nr:hypothetical protein KUTeg_012899 [Tegillarca granosa]
MNNKQKYLKNLKLYIHLFCTNNSIFCIFPILICICKITYGCDWLQIYLVVSLICNTLFQWKDNYFLFIFNFLNDIKRDDFLHP